MDNQEAFDIVVRHLKTQKTQSKGSFGCAYKGDNGNKCAVGALIPDDQYKPSLEGQAVSMIQPDVPALQYLNHHLLLALQLAHDDMENWDESGFKAFDILESIGNKFSLNTDALKS
jgi:hypothetical protein